jgi:hypothetical protein
MRQNGKNNRQRGRGRRNGNGQINRNTTLDSNGPEVRLRGNAQQLYEKYVALGNDASAAGERIQAEAYFQYADHYFRVHSAVIAASEERRERHQGQNKSDAGEPVDDQNAVKSGGGETQTETQTETTQPAEAETITPEKTESAETEEQPSEEDQQVAV